MNPNKKHVIMATISAGLALSIALIFTDFKSVWSLGVALILNAILYELMLLRWG